MEHLKILNLLNEANDSKLVTRKWNVANDQSFANYDVGDIIVTAAPATQVSFKICAPFTKCNIKIMEQQ